MANSTACREWLISEFGYVNKEMISAASAILDGDSEHMKMLANLYEYGAQELFVPKNETKSIYWYGEAARRGNIEASYYYGNRLVFKSDEGVYGDIEQLGFSYMKYAADYGFSRAQFMIGLAYKNGITVNRDRDIALYYLREALRNGENEARELLIEMGDIV